MRIAIAFAAALCIGTVPVLLADDSVATKSLTATTDYTKDGRLPLGTLMERFDALSTRHGWLPETIYSDPASPATAIKSWRTPHRGEALWILSGIHGEEPAGPGDVAVQTGRVSCLGRRLRQHLGHGEDG